MQAIVLITDSKHIFAAIVMVFLIDYFLEQNCCILKLNRHELMPGVKNRFYVNLLLINNCSM